jgi:hypothetical protein
MDPLYSRLIGFCLGIMSSVWFSFSSGYSKRNDAALGQALIMRTKRLTLFVKPISSVAEPHHIYAAPAPGKNFDAALAPAPTLLYSKAKFFKGT